MEIWEQYKKEQEAGQHNRIHPLLGWTELDIWRYTRREARVAMELFEHTGPWMPEDEMPDGAVFAP